jgi:prohead serine protease
MPIPEKPPELETKELGAIEIKDAEKGEVEAVVATLNVVDRDLEIIDSDAIKNGAKVKMSAYGHDAMWGGSPVGKGNLVVDGERVLFKGRFFLSTDRGTEAFRTIKEMGPEQEWSFGYRVLKSEEPNDEQRGKGARRILSKLDAFEVSPVMIGAGIGTRTVGVKEADEAVAAQRAAEAKAAADREAQAKAQAAAEAAVQEAARKAQAAAARDAEIKAQAAAAESKRIDEINRAAAEEFERFQRTRQRIGGY